MRMGRSATFAVAVAVADVAIAPGVQAAATTKVGALPVRVEGDLAEEFRRELDAGLAEGLGRGNFEVVSTSADCRDKSCWVAAADELGARYVVRTVVAAEARSYTVAITLLDGRTGDVTAETSDVCEVCGVREVREIVADQAAGLRKKIDDLVTGAPMLAVHSTPDGALIRIDGETVGEAPVRREVASGKHLARAEKDGYVAVEREFLAVAGVEETLKFELAALPDVRPKWRPWGWVLIGTGVASVAAGVTFAVLDQRPAPGSRCAGDNVDSGGNCRFRYDTALPAAVLISSGALIVLGGAVVAIVTRPRRGGRRKQLASWTRF